ncbi:uncharacterized protein LOC115217881 [Octopus sinensis]|uniref:Uncharacterized protein LOC115217881 n=1 Tax=Octopus sinensis TaxID=2607531 RepID=A0A6P7SZ77_9MOLL|nr:uncharacterized protein LOC115217881 [Octopus sinensis]
MDDDAFYELWESEDETDYTSYSGDKDKPGESLEQYLNELKILAKDCDFIAVNAEQHRYEIIQDAFINGLISNQIRQRLLENKSVDLSTAYDQARSLDVAQQGSSVFSNSECPYFSLTAHTGVKPIDSSKPEEKHSAAIQKGKPSLGFEAIPDTRRLVVLRGKQSVTNAKKKKHNLRLAVSASAGSPFRVTSIVILNNTYKSEALIDSGSTDKSFISERLVNILNIKTVNIKMVIDYSETTNIHSLMPTLFLKSIS